MDFSSLQNLAYLLGKLFWADLEAHHPGIDSLQLPRDVAAAWKQRVLTGSKATTDGGQVSGPSWRRPRRPIPSCAITGSRWALRPEPRRPGRRAPGGDGRLR